jgi:lysophospholipase L1-like esterase
MAGRIPSIRLRRYLWPIRLALVGGSLLFALLAAELVLRAVDAKPQTATVLSAFFEYDPMTGWRGRPGAQSRFWSANFDVVIEHDADGFRESLDQPIAHDAEAGNVTWVIGDSFTWGYGVANGETFVDQLNRLAVGDRRFRNLGHSGFSTLQECLLLESLLEKGYRPREVLVQFCENDVVENEVGSDNNPPRPHARLVGEELEITDLPVRRSGWSAVTWLKTHSLAYNHIHFHLARARRALRWRHNQEKAARLMAESAERMQHDLIESDREHYTPDRIALQAAIYRRMRKACERHNVVFAVVSPFHIDPALREACNRAKVRLIDTSLCFQRFQESAEGDQPWHFPTDHHLNPRGNQLFAEAIHGKLLETESDTAVQQASYEAPDDGSHNR